MKVNDKMERKRDIPTERRKEWHTDRNGQKEKQSDIQTESMKE